MRRLILSLSVLALAACRDSTAPGFVIASKTADYQLTSSPPPPPDDSGTYSNTEMGSHSLNTTYFLNKPGNSGWLTLQKGQAAGVVVDKNARISYSKGAFSGVGTVTYPAGAGVVTLHLASVSQTSSFRATADGYFNVVLNSATYSEGGVTRALAGGAQMSAVRGDSECRFETCAPPAEDF